MGDDRAACQAVVQGYRDAWMGRDPEAMAGLFHPDGVFVDPRHPPFEGHDAITEWYRAAFVGLVDPEVEYVRVLVEPPYAAAEWISRLTRDGVRSEYRGVSIFDVLDGRARYQRDYYYPDPETSVPVDAVDDAGDVGEA